MVSVGKGLAPSTKTFYKKKKISLPSVCIFRLLLLKDHSNFCYLKAHRSNFSTLALFVLKGKGLGIWGRGWSTVAGIVVTFSGHISEMKHQWPNEKWAWSLLLPGVSSLHRPLQPQPSSLTQGLAPFLPLLSPLGHLLLGCLAAVNQAVGGAARRLPLWGELLAKLLQFTLIHEPLLLQGGPLLFQVLLLQDLNHILNWIW